MDAELIIAAARSAIGTPFVHQGRVSGVGLDCVGLGAHIANTLGIAYVEQTGYSRRPSDGQLETNLSLQPHLRQVSDMNPGDFLVLRFFKSPQHFAVFTGDTIIHAWETVGKVCEHRIDEAWRKRVVRIYRLVDAECKQ